MIYLSIPGEPVAKGRPRVMRSGITFTPAKTKNYETLLQELFIIKYPNHIPTEKPLNLKLDAYFSIPKSWSKRKQEEAENLIIRPTKKPDLDNIIKCLDAWNGIAFKDDSQIVGVVAHKWYSTQPRVEINLTEAL